MTEITMPRLSDSMEEGTILKWLVEAGQPVSRGDDLVEIETDKATMTHTADAEGVLEIVAAEGTTLAVGELIARVGVASEQPSAAQAPAASQAPASESETSAVPAQAPAASPAVASSAPANDGAAAPAAGEVSRPPGGDGEPALATPLARRIADAHGVPLASLSGTGPRGRITKADVAAAAGLAPEPPRRTVPANGAAAAAPAAPAAPAPPAPAEPDGGKGSRLEPLTRIQQVIARRMAEAKATVPEFQVQTEVEMDAAIALRARLKAIAGDEPAPSLNDLIVKAAALALREHPRANASYRDGAFELHEQVNVGVAVAADDALVVPTITDADRKSLGEVARTTRRLAARVRSGEITPPELSGATFTVSNLGMFGMTAIFPVINVPQAAILGVGAARAVLARDAHGEVVDRQLLTLTLTSDHRILYGADAARFLADVKRLLESPLLVAL